MEAEEDAFSPDWPLVALGGMSRPFWWEAVQHTLSEADEGLSERSAASAVSWRDAIFTLDHYVEDERCVLQHPSYDWVVHRDQLVVAVLEA